MEETSEELPNFSIGIDLLGPHPTSNRNKAEKNSQVARFANLSEDQLQQILAKRHSPGTKKGDQLVINNFRGKISAFIVVTWEFTKTKKITIILYHNKRLLRADPCCRSVCYKRIYLCF